MWTFEIHPPTVIQRENKHVGKYSFSDTPEMKYKPKLDFCFIKLSDEIFTKLRENKDTIA